MKTITGNLISVAFLIFSTAHLKAQGFEALGGGANGSVYAMCEFNGELIVAGDFTEVGDKAINYIAAWDGKEYHQLGQGLPLSNSKYETIKAVYEYCGRLWVGGTMMFNDSIRHLMIWDGNNWLVPEHEPNGPVRAFETSIYGGSLAIGGQFNQVGGVYVANNIFYYYNPFCIGPQWLIGYGPSGRKTDSQGKVSEYSRINAIKSFHIPMENWVSSPKTEQANPSRSRVYVGGMFEWEDENGENIANRFRNWYDFESDSVVNKEPLGVINYIECYPEEYENNSLYISSTNGVYYLEFDKVVTLNKVDNIATAGDAIGLFGGNMYVSGLNTKYQNKIFRLNRENEVVDSLPMIFHNMVNVIYEYNQELYIGGSFNHITDLETGELLNGHAIIKLTSPRTGVADLSVVDELNLWPNPAESVLTVGLENKIASNIELVNLAGQKVLSLQGSFTGNQVIDLSNVPAGIYIFRLLTRSGNVNKRISIIR